MRRVGVKSDIKELGWRRGQNREKRIFRLPLGDLLRGHSGKQGNCGGLRYLNGGLMLQQTENGLAVVF